MPSQAGLTPKRIVISLLVLLAAIYGFVANEGRKEIYYLCGNFTKGVTYSEVVRQLATTHFTHYAVADPPTGKRIIHNSNLHFNALRCTIDFNAEDKVISAFYQ
ncbi:hypothetical protein LZP69_09530 [Shewanella sp. AS1]|uniref:hypothetical protein n=1 Tax=Shewanella sp. AS1 TaxID=2907626 RepID=UPI001F1E0EEA|nr:hypothetical protein [Shewanella sp. AS1]MCE9679412.1 hypothetical protein [Shewanella sp. AS1]